MNYPLTVKIGSRTDETFANIDELKAKISLVSNTGIKNLWAALGEEDVDEAFILWNSDERLSRSMLVAKNKMKGFLKKAAELNAEPVGKDIWYAMMEPGTTTEYGWATTWAELRGEEPPPAPTPEPPAGPAPAERPKRARKAKAEPTTPPPPATPAEPVVDAEHDETPVDTDVSEAIRAAVLAYGVVVDVIVRSKSIFLSGDDAQVQEAARLLGEKIEPTETAWLVRRKDMRLPEPPSVPKAKSKSTKAKPAKTPKAESVTVASVTDVPKPKAKPEPPASMEIGRTKATKRKLAADNGPRVSLGLFSFERRAAGEAVMAHDFYGDGSYERTCPKCGEDLIYSNFGARLMRRKRDGAWIRCVQPQCSKCRRGSTKHAKAKAAVRAEADAE